MAFVDEEHWNGFLSCVDDLIYTERVRSALQILVGPV